LSIELVKVLRTRCGPRRAAWAAVVLTVAAWPAEAGGLVRATGPLSGTNRRFCRNEAGKGLRTICAPKRCVHRKGLRPHRDCQSAIRRGFPGPGAAGLICKCDRDAGQPLAETESVEQIPGAGRWTLSKRPRCRCERRWPTGWKFRAATPVPSHP